MLHQALLKANMTSFLISALLLLIVALFWFLRPLFFKPKELATSRRQMNAAIYREELEKLEAERASGAIDSETYDQSHAEMRQRLFQDTDEPDDLSVMGSPKKTIIGICIFVVTLSIGFYALLGDAPRIAQKNAEKPMTKESVDQMVAQFAEKLEKEPDNLQGWAMLARSYRVLGRDVEAQKAYERAGSYVDSDPQLLADYADVIAANNKGNFAGKPMQLLKKALTLDPNNLLALWLSGTAAFNAQDYKVAILYWERLAKQLPADSDEARSISLSIEEARSKGGLAPVSKPAVSTKGVSGQVDLAPKLKSQLKSGDILMVIARKPGERMPVAVFKTAVTSFPMSFALNDSLAMSPSNLISQLPEVSVEVRISKTGMAMPESGDLISASQIVRVGSNNIQLLVDAVRP